MKQAKGGARDVETQAGTGYAGYADGKDLLSHAYKDNVNYNGWQTAVGIVHKF